MTNSSTLISFMTPEPKGYEEALPVSPAMLQTLIKTLKALEPSQIIDVDVTALMMLAKRIELDQATPELAREHVDYFINNGPSDPATRYARFVMNGFRAPSIQRIAFESFMQEYTLYCVYDDRWHRVTGASRLGDVWLNSNFSQDVGYEKRVGWQECTSWSRCVPPSRDTALTDFFVMNQQGVYFVIRGNKKEGSRFVLNLEGCSLYPTLDALCRRVAENCGADVDEILGSGAEYVGRLDSGRLFDDKGREIDLEGQTLAQVIAAFEV